MLCKQLSCSGVQTVVLTIKDKGLQKRSNNTANQIDVLISSDEKIITCSNNREKALAREPRHNNNNKNDKNNNSKIRRVGVASKIKTIIARPFSGLTSF